MSVTRKLKTRKQEEASVVIFVTTPCSSGVILGDQKFSQPQ